MMLAYYMLGCRIRSNGVSMLVLAKSKHTTIDNIATLEIFARKFMRTNRMYDSTRHALDTMIL